MHTLAGAPRAAPLNAVVMRLASVGWIGVDLFFVLSGFLITGILLDQRGSARFLRTFYGRRVLRIVPVYVVFLACWMWVAPSVDAISLPTAERLRHVQGWYWTFLANVFLAVRGWTVAADGPTHLWSLAVEEQFYLIWPFVVLALPPRVLPRAALACIVGAECCRIIAVVSGAPPQTNYVLLPTRMDTLAVGAFLACAARDPGLLRLVQRHSVVVIGVATAAILAVAGIAHTFDFENPFVQLVGYPALALLGGVLVFAVSKSPTLFAGRTLRFLGRYSYGIYVWHWLVIVALRHTTTVLEPRLRGGSYLAFYGEALAAVIGASVLVALASWYAVEAPFLRLKRLFPYARRVEG
jgi:peptidoglycan/LPS O-acetylase OafA/YrhL